MRHLAVTAVLVALLTAGTEGHRGFWRHPNFWQNWFCSHWFSLPWLNGAGTPFETDRIPEVRTLVGTCTTDIGTCPVGSCSTKSYRSILNCPDDGYICPQTEARSMDCGVFGTKEYQYVTKCGCCLDNGITVEGTVSDSATNAPLENIRVWFGNKYAGNTGVDGQITNIVGSDIRSLVIRAQDKSGVYMDAIKVVDIPNGFRGPVEVGLVMIKKATPVTIDSSVLTTLSLSDDPLDPTSGNANIQIQPNSFRTQRGRVYNGPVNVGITFIDTSGDSEQVIPGQFLTPVRGLLENMISDGIVSFDFKDTNGNDLKAGQMKFTVREGMTLWSLNTASGLWEPMRTSSGRRRRQVVLNEFLTQVFPGQWYNIDKIPGAPRCYFKARIFNATSGNEITSSVTTSFRPEITAFTNLMQRLRLYAGSTNTPNVTCYEVRCPVVSDPSDALVGFINMTATEVVSVGGINLPSVTLLTPRSLGGYAAPIQTELSDVQYAIAPNNLDVFVNFVSDTAGPFYPTLDACQASTVDQPALHFFKQEPPSYEPVPAGTEICTARIALRDSWNFYNYTSTLTTLPNVTAISVWEESGTQHYFTDTATMENSTVPGENFIFICIKYRCSQDNESTTVYLDIDIPTVNVTYNYTDENGTVVNSSYTSRDFHCYGTCSGNLCPGEFDSSSSGGVSTINGAFIAPTNVTSGPDFYNSSSTDCRTRLQSEPFAYDFFCTSKYNGRDGEFFP